MSSMAMDARKQRILEAIVALYANGGEPVCMVPEAERNFTEMILTLMWCFLIVVIAGRIVSSMN